jgi:hypothetical protein
MFSEAVELRKITKAQERLERKYEANPKAHIRNARIMKKYQRLQDKADVLMETIRYHMGVTA